MMNDITKFILSFFGITLFFGCIKDQSFDPLTGGCDSELVANASYADIKDLYVDRTFQIQQDLVIEGYVVSSDKAGNFFGVLHFQDRPTNPTQGFQIEIDLRDSHLLYPTGSKIYVNLKGLYLGKSKGVYKLGGVFTSFGNQSVGRLPAPVVQEHLLVSCEGKTNIEPVQVDMNGFSETLANTLVRLGDVQIWQEELGGTFAAELEETERTLIDCGGQKLMLLNSGFADFQGELLPEGNGSITGVLLQENDDYQLVIRDLADIDFSNERCEDPVDEFTSPHIFISELADPDNNAAARFVELYNAGTAPLPLKGWTLRRYTNANTEIGSTIDLSDLTIDNGGTLVISPNATEFEMVYGVAPDMGVGTNSPADSNGDDNLELVDPFGNVIDVFGLVGEDGTGTNHEFEDGRAVRNPGINKGNKTYNFSEWSLYNDSGESGTIDQPQIAPEDFTPGRHNL